MSYGQYFLIYKGTKVIQPFNAKYNAPRCDKYALSEKAYAMVVIETANMQLHSNYIGLCIKTYVTAPMFILHHMRLWYNAVVDIFDICTTGNEFMVSGAR